jgi:hypothetical protein
MDNRSGAPAPPIDESANRVRSAADDAISEVKHAVKDAAATIKDKAKEAAEGVQAKTADQTRTAANTLRETANNLSGEVPWMKTALNRTADGFDHLTSALNRGDIGQGLNAISDFARRQPALFLGLSVAAGFALARVGKTAIEEVQDSRTSSRGDEHVDEAVAPYAPVAGA